MMVYIIINLVELLVFTPSPNISDGQEAVFNCYSEVYLEPIWSINGEAPCHPSNADRSDITVIGEGTSNSTLIIDGLIENNGTTIECAVAGLINGTLVNKTSDMHILFIQGIM